MPSRHDAAESLADIVENVERIEIYVRGMDQAAFGRDGLTRDAVERCMGNRLRHAYDRISPDVIWNTIRNDLPGLAKDLRRALATLKAP